MTLTNVILLTLKISSHPNKNLQAAEHTIRFMTLHFLQKEEEETTKPDHLLINLVWFWLKKISYTWSSRSPTISCEVARAATYERKINETPHIISTGRVYQLWNRNKHKEVEQWTIYTVTRPTTSWAWSLTCGVHLLSPSENRYR